MKKLLCLILALAMLTGIQAVSADAFPRTEAEYDSIFEKDKIIDVHIEIADADWEDMKANPRNEEYHAADITVDGVTVENAGIRTKGNSTLQQVASSDSDRYSFRIKFSKYVKGQRLLGLDELCLNNGVSDPSYMREYLHYEMLREMGMNVPETAFCNVYLNGELFGFYLAIEALDDAFLENNFGVDYESGNFYKMDERATLQYVENSDYTYAELKKGTDTEKTGLKNFIQVLNAMPEGEKGDIESVLDVDSALKYIAGNLVLGSYDSYNGSLHHNYYLYEDTDGVFTVVPWDFNMSFDGFTMGGGSGTTIGIDTPVSGTTLEESPLIGKLLAVDEYKQQYYGYIQEMMEYLETLEQRIADLAQLIRPYVENDPTAFYTIEEFDNATTYNPDETSSMGGMQPPEDMNGGQQGNPFELLRNLDPNTITQEQLETIKSTLHLTDEEYSTLKDAILIGDTDAVSELIRSKMGGDRGGKGGGGMMANHKSIVNFTVDRLANLKEQFAGTASTTTETSSGFGGGWGGPGREEGQQPPDFHPEDMMPPEGGGKRPEFGAGFGGMHGNQSTNNPIRVILNGKIVTFDTDPILENDRTLVPARAIFEALGAEVSWDEAGQTATITKDGTTIQLTVGETTAYVNGEAVELDTAAKVTDDRILVPVRFIAEKMNLQVTWTENTKLIEIVTPKV